MAGIRLKEGAQRSGLQYTPEAITLNGIGNIVLFWHGGDGPQLILYATGIEEHCKYTFSNDSFKAFLQRHDPIVASYIGGETEPHTVAHALKDETSSTANKHVHCLYPSAAGAEDNEIEEAFGTLIVRLADQGLLTHTEARNCRAYFELQEWC